MLIELYNVVKHYGDRLIFKVNELKVYDSDQIGIVGLNGSGKTTLLNILFGKTSPDEGIVRVSGSCEYIGQLKVHDSEASGIDPELASLFSLPGNYRDNLSGGEKTRYKIAAAFSGKSDILFADEPTSNLDLKGIELFEKCLDKHDGALLMISHDRALLDKFCNKILEIDEGSVKVYAGNYSDYIAQKRQELEKRELDYQQYVKQRNMLKAALNEKKAQSRSIRKTPKRMGNSEARLHKMGNQRARANLDRAAKAIESRIERLEVKDRPKNLEKMKLQFMAKDNLHCKIILSGDKLNKSFDAKVIFEDACFKLYNGDRTAIIGDNGSGKTTLINMIINKETGIKAARNLKIGYFSQDLDTLQDNKSIWENLIACGIYDETHVRTILARLLFKGNDIDKKVEVLSGGERVRAAIAKIVLSDYNLLIMDEPTNYLDVFSLEAVESVLTEYQGNLLFVSHDRMFVNKVATNLLLIENKKISQFSGSYREVWLNRNNQDSQLDEKNSGMLLEHRLTELIARLSLPEKSDDLDELDREYQHVLRKLREIRKQP